MKKHLRKRSLGVLVASVFVVFLVNWLVETPKGHLNFARYGHTALLLPDGRVLVMGGFSSAGTNLFQTQIISLVQRIPWLGSHISLTENNTDSGVSNCEIFDPKTHYWTRVCRLSSTRYYPAAYLLNGSKVFYGGGASLGIGDDIDDETKPSQPSELLDISTLKIASRPLPSKGDEGKTVLFQLSESQVLKLQPSKDWENLKAWVYDLNLDTWTRCPESDCKGGFTDIPRGYRLPGGDLVLEDVDTLLYDRQLKTWTEIKQPDLPFYGVTILNDGSMMRVGGIDEASVRNEVYSFNLHSKNWLPLASMHVPRSGVTLTVLQNGQVLAAGGGVASCELFDPDTKEWKFTGSLHIKRGFHTATLLQDGRVLVVGGMDGDCNALSTCEIYDPAKGECTELLN